MEANKTKAVLLLSLLAAVAICSGCSNNQSAPAAPASLPPSAAQTQESTDEHAQQQQIKTQEIQNSNLPPASKQALLDRMATQKTPVAN
jgi:PBP1b-binding outer membrane lipoprotein LpoB